ncbi:MAG: hypothetical protein KQI81_08660 [Deltaproteobacteria bacterium]|nr:hypothetical protein [Deltaproteobacteria bacterium]
MMEKEKITYEQAIQRAKWFIYGYFTLMDDIEQVPENHWVDLAPGWELNIRTDTIDVEGQLIVHIIAILYRRYYSPDLLDLNWLLFDLEENLAALVERDETIWQV